MGTCGRRTAHARVDTATCGASQKYVFALAGLDAVQLTRRRSAGLLLGRSAGLLVGRSAGLPPDRSAGLCGPCVSAANREEVARLREQLSKCTANQVSKAQCIYDNICALCNYSKQTYPRACRTCGYYGHSHHHCPVHKARLEYQASLAQNEVCEQECTPAQWRTVQRIRLLFEAGEEAGKLGYQ